MYIVTKMDIQKLEILPEFLGESNEDSLTELLEQLSSDDSSSDESSSESSDSEDSCEAGHVKINNLMATIDSYSESDFKSHFRLSRSTVAYLTDRYSQSEYGTQAGSGRIKIFGFNREILLYIWYVSSTLTYQQLGNLFGIAKSAAWYAVRRVCRWIISIGHEFVKWPETNEIKKKCRKFEVMKGIPGVIGVIGCSHINIKAPKINKENYCNRKKNYSLVLQAVVDVDKKFIDIYCGEPGSLHDSLIFRRSDLFKKASTDSSKLFPNNTYILGHSGYACTSWLVPPYTDNGALSHAQKNFNNIHSATRNIVKNTFVLLKTKFRRLLHFNEQTDLCAITNLIMSTCILHNISIIMEENLEEINDDETSEVFNNCLADPSNNRREILFNYLMKKHIIS